MNAPEDAATVLEQFMHDVANIPAEVQHLLQEMTAKDTQIANFKVEIDKRDAALQKWVRVNGGHVHNPKEEQFSRYVSECYDRCEILQAEKLGLSEKALLLLERQMKRLDVGVKGLQNADLFPTDWNGPSLLSGTGTGPNTPASGNGSGQLPLQSISSNVGVTAGAPSLANAAQARMAHANNRTGSGAAGASTPSNVSRSQREGSSDTSKRRRLNASLGNLPTASSSLRQSSLGPGTPKAGTPSGTGPSANSSSRAGSAQPSRAPTNKKGATTSTTAPPNARKTAPHQAPATSNTRKRPRPSTSTTTTTTSSKNPKDRRRTLATTNTARNTPTHSLSPTPSSAASASPTPSSLHTTKTPANTHAQRGGNSKNDSNDEEENDTTLYCYCSKVSYGDMVCCDNDDCGIQWFHWDCVELKREPEGEWLCPDCRKLPRGKIRVSRED
ncbi:hypothetical protein MBLNU230_g7806t1 [Neophaeotheca triangularis]